MQAFMYARVSSREQEREGYSIPAQRKLLSGYAVSGVFEVADEFVDVESAKNPGRKEFSRMVRLLQTSPACRIVLVEKTDRLYRNRTDSLIFEELIEKHGVEVHLVKEGRIISKSSRSQDKFMHDIHVAVAKNYVENLKEEVKKGMREKAEQGIYPSCPPFGYRNNKVARTIELDSLKAPILRRMFELYASGDYSLTPLRKVLQAEHDINVARSYLEKILKNRFYLGYFFWQGVEYKGTHEPLISVDLFNRVQRVFDGRTKPKYRKHAFAFGGLLVCGHDGCTVSAEIHKRKYIYYRCSYGHGKCDLPYLREEQVSEMLGGVLRDIYVPEHTAKAIVNSIDADRNRFESERRKRTASIQRRLAALRTRMDQMYEDKLDGRIDEEFWSRKMSEWRRQEQELQATSNSLNSVIPENHVLTAKRILELANKAYSLYLTRNHRERGQLLKTVLSNCITDGVTVTPTYRKPFDLIFERAKNQEWWAL